MARNRFKRKLAAIPIADAQVLAGVMGADEEGTLERLKRINASDRCQDQRAFTAHWHGETGDPMLVELSNVVICRSAAPATCNAASESPWMSVAVDDDVAEIDSRYETDSLALGHSPGPIAAL